MNKIKAGGTMQLVWVFLLLLMTSTALAHGESTFAEAEELIESKAQCSELTEDQLEMIGDYYMEQMHPGEQHERMDVMMGEGSTQLRQMHVNMARNMYCGEHEVMSMPMMHQTMHSPFYYPWVLYSAITAVFVIILWMLFNFVGKRK